MKSLRGWDEVVSVENLWRAWCEFRSGRSRRPRVAGFALDADRHVHRMARLLAEESWRPGGYRLIRITDPKRRLVAAAPVADRVVHHALHRVVEPRMARSYIEQSYACLPGRGSHRAVLRFRGELRRWRFVMQLDVRRYFYSIDRARLRSLLEPRLREAPLRRLVNRILDSGSGLYREPRLTRWLGWDGPGRPGRGLPIGNLTSQWWGNLYLDGLDHHAKRALRVPSYQRYMDEFTLFGDDRAAMVDLREALAGWLQQERGLELKDPDAPARRCDRGEHRYLGYVVSRRGFQPGPKARSRLPERLSDAAERGEGPLHDSVEAAAAMWMFPG